MHFRVKNLSRLKKSEEKTPFSIHFQYHSVTVTIFSHGDNLQGFIAQETKYKGDLGTATQNLEEMRKIG